MSQIQVELHVRQGVSIENFFLAADRASLRIFHKERNHWGCGGYKCVEYSFVSESFLREANRDAMCPKEKIDTVRNVTAIIDQIEADFVSRNESRSP